MQIDINMLRGILEELAKVQSETLGLIYDFFRKLNADKTGEFLKQFKLFLRGEMVEKIEQVIGYLEFISTIVIPATTTKFVAKEKFVINTESKVQVRINWLGDNFRVCFLNGDGKIEDSITEQTLRYHKLLQSTVDGLIITELGGEAKAEITLSEMFSLIEKQGKGENGVLLNNGNRNIFYIKDQNGVLRTVSVEWGNLGWSFNAHSIKNLHWWDVGRQVFSRNPVLNF